MLSRLVAAANILVAPEQVCDRYNHDCFAVSMKKREQIVGPVPQELSMDV